VKNSEKLFLILFVTVITVIFASIFTFLFLKKLGRNFINSFFDWAKGIDIINIS